MTPEAQYNAGASLLEKPLPHLQRSKISFKALNHALDRLTSLHPLRKPQFLKACIATITADGNVTTVEREIVRVVSDAIDCPMPPI